MSLLKTMIDNMNYFASMILFVMGLYIVLINANLLKKIIGINIIETAIFLFFVSIGYVSEGNIPILEKNDSTAVFINPLPTALILTGIVIAVSVTAYALGLVIKLHEEYGTINMDKIMKIREQTNS